jgi:hypothetical protein
MQTARGRFVTEPNGSPEHRIVETVREELHQLRRDLDDFDEEMVSAGINYDVRMRLRLFWDERLAGRIIERGERRMRGMNGG